MLARVFRRLRLEMILGNVKGKQTSNNGEEKKENSISFGVMMCDVHF